jgi:hypothetical protein
VKDVLAILVMVGFFVLTGLLVRLFDRLQGGDGK